MSTVLMAACWPLQMPASAKAVLMSLADQANDTGVCWPAVGTICRRTCLSERAVQRAIHWLGGSGVLMLNRTQGRATNYQVNPSGFTGSADLFTAPARGAPPSMRHPRQDDAPPPQMRHPTPARDAGDPRKSGTQNQEKKEKQEKKAKFDAGAIELPPWLSRVLWERWCKDRRKRGKTVTEDAAALQLEKLDGYRGEGYTPTEVIEHSIAGGFQGLYPPKRRGGMVEVADPGEWWETARGARDKAKEVGYPLWDESIAFTAYIAGLRKLVDALPA